MCAVGAGMTFAGRGMRCHAQTFERMKEAHKGHAKPPVYLSTHPNDDERIRRQKEWMDSALTVSPCCAPEGLAAATCSQGDFR